jgi:hypothetical protein
VTHTFRLTVVGAPARCWQDNRSALCMEQVRAAATAWCARHEQRGCHTGFRLAYGTPANTDWTRRRVSANAPRVSPRR